MLLNLVARPEIEKPEQLRGKNIESVVHRHRFIPGAHSHEAFWSGAGKDVAIVGVPATDCRCPAGRSCAGGSLRVSGHERAVKLGNRVLLHLPTLNIPYASTGVSTGETSSVTIRIWWLIFRLSEAIALMKKDRAFTMKVLSKYLRDWYGSTRGVL
jgi:hypothetical protein